MFLLEYTRTIALLYNACCSLMTYSGGYYNKVPINCLFNDSLLMHKCVIFNYSECKNDTTTKSFAIVSLLLI